MSDKIVEKNIVDEMSNSFLDYSMSVIISRALPDVRDGLKPVHRRILFAMNDLGNYADKPYKKSARIVGDVIGKYHPHGDTSVYSAMVRMAQEFSYRNPLVDGHGNFGSLDGDGAAAMRYTEARMSKLAMELLKDIQKNTVDFIDNYDASEKEPKVLPSRFPNLLVNGSSGIAVGMATNIPPHNLGEVIDAIIAYLINKDISIDDIMMHIKGPDFPLGGEILGVSGIEKAYKTGNGTIKVRGKYKVFEEKNGKSTIIFSEIPFQVNKASIVEKIAENVKTHKIEGITALRDESDRDGIRIVIELSRAVSSDVVINKLFKYTQLETNFSANMLALVDGKPEVLNIKQFIEQYVKHQEEIITRRTQFDLDRAAKRAHILAGLKIALDNIDEIIKIIKASPTDSDAITELSSKYHFSEIQAKSILEMKLKKLTGLEREKIDEELQELEILIKELQLILGSIEKIHEIIKEQLLEIKMKYGEPRRSIILDKYVENDIDYEKLIEEEEVIITITEEGYIKRLKSNTYKIQNRGGKGLKGMNVNDEDGISNIIYTSTHSDLLFFTKTGKVFKCRAHHIPEYSRTAKGIPLQNLIDIEAEDYISNIISLKNIEETDYLFFVTKKGIAKKILLSEFSRINKNGKRAIKLIANDEVVSTLILKEKDNIIISSHQGKAIVTALSDYRPIGRTSQGVKAITLKNDDYIIGAGKFQEDDIILTLTERGYGKATKYDKYRVQKRGGKGLITIKTSEKNGHVAGIKILNQNTLEENDLILISKMGIVIRLIAENIKISGRNTSGVKMMNLSENDILSKIAIVSRETINEEGETINEESEFNEEK